MKVTRANSKILSDSKILLDNLITNKYVGKEDDLFLKKRADANLTFEYIQKALELNISVADIKDNLPSLDHNYLFELLKLNKDQTSEILSFFIKFNKLHDEKCIIRSQFSKNELEDFLGSIQTYLSCTRPITKPTNSQELFIQNNVEYFAKLNAIYNADLTPKTMNDFFVKNNKTLNDNIIKLLSLNLTDFTRISEIFQKLNNFERTQTLQHLSITKTLKTNLPELNNSVNHSKSSSADTSSTPIDLTVLTTTQTTTQATPAVNLSSDSPLQPRFSNDPREPSALSRSNSSSSTSDSDSPVPIKKGSSFRLWKHKFGSARQLPHAKLDTPDLKKSPSLQDELSNQL
jgi:hypothetical protein